MSARRNHWLLAIAATIAIAIWLTATFDVEAHSGFDRSQPAPAAVLSTPPDEVDIWFTAAVSDDESANEIGVTGPSGGRIDSGPAVLDPEDPTHLQVPIEPDGDGTYTVEWRNTSAEDGDELTGSFEFTVRAAAENGDDGGVDWWLLGGLGAAGLLVAGIVAFAASLLKKADTT